MTTWNKEEAIEQIKHGGKFGCGDDNDWEQELAINPFVLANENWRHENYHSRILAGLLRSGIGDHAFLKSFIEYLSKRANPRVAGTLKGLKISNGIAVDTEVLVDNDRRIDILIQDREWAIIVENKIAGAPDMKRQLPDYLNFVQKDGVPVVAIVYLKAYLDDFGPTDREGWSAKEIEEVDAKLIPVAGFKTNDGGWQDSLCGGWIHGTAEDNPELKLACVDRTLMAYEQLLRAQAACIRDDDKISHEYENAVAGGSTKFSQQELAGWLTRKLERECTAAPFLKKWIFKKGNRVSCVFENLGIENVNIVMEVHCEDLDEKAISMSIRYGGAVDKESVFKKIEPILSDAGFRCCKPSRSDWRLMITGLKLSPVELVAKTNSILGLIAERMSAIRGILS